MLAMSSGSEPWRKIEIDGNRKTRSQPLLENERRGKRRGTQRNAKWQVPS